MIPIVSGMRATCAVMVFVAGLGAAVQPAGAEEPTATGWWWAGRPSVVLPPLLSPVPEPPDGGLYVAAGPSGVTGIAALRFAVDPDASVGTLTLTIAEASGTVVIDACVTASEWEPGENGGWDRRPEADCEMGSVASAVNEDQTQISFAVASLQGDDGVIDVVLLPGVDPESQTPSSFSAAFEPPGPDALEVTDPIEPSSLPTHDETTAPAAPPAGPRNPPPLVPRLPPPPVASAPPTITTSPSTGTETALPSSHAPQPTTRTSAVALDAGFRYPAVLALPLLLLCAATYLGWALTRPITVRPRLAHAHPVPWPGA